MTEEMQTFKEQEQKSLSQETKPYPLSVDDLETLRNYYWKISKTPILISGAVCEDIWKENKENKNAGTQNGIEIQREQNKKVVHEIRFIQDELKKNNIEQIFSYFQVCHSIKGERPHFELFLISKDTVIKTPWWRDLFKFYIHEQLLPEMYDSKPKDFLLEKYFNKGRQVVAILPTPQADWESCGSLCVSYAQNPQDLTLKFRFYDEHGMLCRFFLTSPATLFYSQSTSYNELLRQMVSESKIIAYPTSKGKITLNSIEEALRYSRDFAQEKLQQNPNNQEAKDILIENEELLKALPRFRENWLKAYQEMMIEREKFQDKDTNRSLLNLSYHHKKLVDEQKGKNPKISFADMQNHFMGLKEGNSLSPAPQNDKKNNANYTFTTFLQNKKETVLGKISAAISNTSFGTIVHCLAMATLKEIFCYGIDHFFKTNSVEATQKFIEEHMEFLKIAAPIAGITLLGIGMVALYIAYCAEKNHQEEQNAQSIPGASSSISL